MPRGKPPLTLREVIRILEERGYTWREGKGDHRVYTDREHVVLVDMGRREFGSKEITTLIHQMGLDRVSFYTSTDATARKINRKRAK